MADITREKETEALLESRARHLEALVRERTTRLQEAVIELEHFSYTLAHDLRAPLRIMIGFGELMLQESPVLSATHQQYVGRISTAAHRMDLLIRDALDYNKLVRQNFALEPIDPGTLLQQLVDTYPEFHEARTHISLSGPFPLVLGNSALLTQCFSNLLGNALKFIEPKRTPRVRLSAEDLGERVRIWIEDNGIGIPEDCVDRIFEMFHRLNPEFEGTGIGLALVKKAAHRMRGSVGVVSHLGHGSRFWIELDKAEQERPEQVEPMERS
jgi:signal transduction histidine kinase